jgi:hypothetical protein
VPKPLAEENEIQAAIRLSREIFLDEIRHIFNVHEDSSIFTLAVPIAE